MSMSQSQMIQFLVWLSSLEAYYIIQVNWKSCKMYFSFKISCSSTSHFRKIQDITNLSLSEFHHFCSSRKKQPNPRALQNLKNFDSNFLLKMAKFSWTEAWVLLSVQRKKKSWLALFLKCLTWVKEHEIKDQGKHLMRGKGISQSLSQKVITLFTEWYFQVTFCTVSCVFYSEAHSRTY